MHKENSSWKKFLYRRARYLLLNRNIYGITSPLRKFPDFIVIGGKRCGTTTLFEFLQQHPSINKPYIDHLGFFDDNYRLGMNYYKSFFPLQIKNQKNLDYEVTTSYLTSPYVAERIWTHIPNIKIIILLRNPTDRAWSEFNSNARVDKTFTNFESFVEKELIELESYDISEKIMNNDYDLANPKTNYIKKGLYAYHLKKWLNLFPRKNFLIIQTEAFSKDEDYVFNKIFDFLKLPSFKIKNLKRMNKGQYNPMPIKTRDLLDNFFDSKNKELYELINEKFDW